MKSSSAFLSDHKNWRAPRPPPALIFFPKSTDQNFEIAILFRIVENHNNYVFGDDLLPHSSRGRGCNLQTLTSVYIQQWLLGSVQTFSGGFFWFGGGVEGRGLYGRIFPWRNMSWGKRNSMKRARDFLALL